MKSLTKKIASVVAIALGAGSAAFYLHQSSAFEQTDNAYLTAHIANLSAKVGGLITEVLVEENQRVVKGQVLVRLDPRDYQNALAVLVAARGEAEAQIALAAREFKRTDNLVAAAALPTQDRDTDSTKVQVLKKRLDGLKAQIAQASLNLEYCEIKAPSDGVVGRKLAEPGMVLSVGQSLMAFVDSRDPWVVANFKETQLKNMSLGQKVEIVVDSIAGKGFSGTIESIAPGTGATFALIPPENATGNFTKIVQRVPVRIRLDADSLVGYETRLFPGLSVDIKVLIQESGEGARRTIVPSTQVSQR